jgi:hypothetical protein
MDLYSLLPDARTSPFEQDHAHMLVQAREYQEAHQGLLPNTPFWHSMELRQSEHFARFTHWHPDMSRWITENANAQLSLLHPQLPILQPQLVLLHPQLPILQPQLVLLHPQLPILQPQLVLLPTEPVVVVPDAPPPNVVNAPEPSSFTIAALAVVFAAIGWYFCHGRDVPPKIVEDKGKASGVPFP